MHDYPKAFWLFLLTTLLSGCSSRIRPEVDRQNLSLSYDIDIQGHRGCRGLMPENTIPGFLKAVTLGVTTLEMDVVITKNSEVLVSHEPFLSNKICFGPDGEEITEKNEKDYNLFEMTYDEIRQCDCGSKSSVGFPDQEKIKVGKPLLVDVIDTVESYLQNNNLPPIQYNIEPKTNSETDGTFHPEPEKFVELLMAVLEEKELTQRVIIQSFDTRTLRYVHEKYPEVKLALLITNKELPETNIDNLGFIPAIYSPYYLLVNDNLINYAHENAMKVIPWTVNTPAEIRRILALGVDGIITDYPDRAVEVLNE